MELDYLKQWAKKEIELAAAGNNSKIRNELDNHYAGAYAVYCNFVDWLKILDPPEVFKTILMQLLNGECLTPIEDREEDWIFVEGFDPGAGTDNPGYTIFQCNRYPSLFKKIIYDKKDGDNIIEFNDVSRIVCIDINSKKTYTGGMGHMVINELLPIKMPYIPLTKIKVFTESFKYHKDSGDYDTIGVLHYRTSEGQLGDIMRFFKEDPTTHNMVEINNTEYFSRKIKAKKEGLIKDE